MVPYLPVSNNLNIAVAARIVSFSQEVVTAWKQDVLLQCKRVGAPPALSAWKLRGRTLETGGRKQVFVV
jgi:hypothetical protein